MNPRVSQRPDDVVLQAVKRNCVSSHYELPEIEEPHTAKPAESLWYAGLQHTVHRQRIVCVDVVGKPGIRSGKPCGRRNWINNGNVLDHFIQLGVVFREPGEVDPSPGVDVTVENSAPGHLPGIDPEIGWRPWAQESIQNPGGSGGL